MCRICGTHRRDDQPLAQLRIDSTSCTIAWTWLTDSYVTSRQPSATKRGHTTYNELPDCQAVAGVVDDGSGALPWVIALLHVRGYALRRLDVLDHIGQGQIVEATFICADEQRVPAAKTL